MAESKKRNSSVRKPEDLDEPACPPADLAGFESALCRVYKNVPELFVHIKADDLDPENCPTDRALVPLIRHIDTQDEEPQGDMPRLN